MIGETSRELPDDAESLFDLPQQQASRIRNDGSAIEIGDHFAAVVRLKSNG